MRRIRAELSDLDSVMFDTERLAVRFWKEAGLERGIEQGDSINGRIEREKNSLHEFADFI